MSFDRNPVYPNMKGAMMEITHLVQAIQEGLAVEHTPQQIHSVEDLAAWHQRRRALKQQLEHLSTEVRNLREQVQALSSLPSLGAVQWAQAVLAMPNLVFLELETTGLSQDAEIIRALALDQAGALLLDVYVRPTQPLSRQIEMLTGITNDAVMQQGVTEETVLAQLHPCLRGKYTLSYNLEFDRQKLNEAALRCQQEPLPVIGDDLMQQAMRYFAIQSYPKLETLCQRVGHPLPPHRQQTALDHANGQRALLQAMASAVVDMPAFETEGEEDEDLDAHPF